MSLGPRIEVKETKCGAGGTPVVGYMNISGGAIPPCCAGIFSRANSEYCLSLLTSLRIRRRMPPTDQLERSRGLFLNSASALFEGGGRSGRGELSEDNSLSAGGSLSPTDYYRLEVQDECVPVYSRPGLLLSEFASGHSPAAR